MTFGKQSSRLQKCTWMILPIKLLRRKAFGYGLHGLLGSYSFMKNPENAFPIKVTTSTSVPARNSIQTKLIINSFLPLGCSVGYRPLSCRRLASQLLARTAIFATRLRSSSTNQPIVLVENLTYKEALIQSLLPGPLVPDADSKLPGITLKSFPPPHTT